MQIDPIATSTSTASTQTTCHCHVYHRDASKRSPRGADHSEGHVMGKKILCNIFPFSEPPPVLALPRYMGSIVGAPFPATPPPGTCFNFHSGRGGDPSPLDTPPPSPPPAQASPYPSSLFSYHTPDALRSSPEKCVALQSPGALWFTFLKRGWTASLSSCAPALRIALQDRGTRALGRV